VRLLEKSFKVTRAGVDQDPFAKSWPMWLRYAKIMLVGYREQGWSAVDQREGPNRGKTIASGKWSDRLVLRRDGSWSSYPDRSAECLATSIPAHPMNNHEGVV
jgi:hypothetical protein